MGRPLGSTNVWPDQQIKQIQREIKSELNDGFDESKPKDRLSKALNGFSKTAELASSEGRLRCYVYIMSALVHHERWSGLSDREIETLRSFGCKLLQLQGVGLENERLAYLSGEFHLVLSLIYRKQGKPWKSAWEQQLAYRLTKKKNRKGKGNPNLGLALRSQRLGYTDLALENFWIVENEATDQTSFYHARLGRIKSLRLAARREDAKNLIAQTMKDADLDWVRTELEWEEKLLLCIEDGDWSRLTAAVKKGREWYSAPYMLETVLLVNAISRHRWKDQIPKVTTLKRRGDLDFTVLHSMLTACLEIEMGYDSKYSFDLRLERVGNIVEQVDEYLSLDHELLVWAATARWLARNHMKDLARLCLFRYESLSKQLSSGRSNDALGVLGDLLAKPWYSGTIDEVTPSNLPKQSA